MRRKERWLAILVCLMVALTMTACQNKNKSADAAEETTVESTQAATQPTTAKKETKKKKEPTKKTKETKKKTTATTAEKKTSSKSKSSAKATKNKKPSGHVLTIKKGSKKVYFTESQLADMGRVTYKYSFRNKDSSHRQFLSCTGVKFSTVLSKSGLSGSTARIRSTDGYTKEYSISKLKSTKKAFLKKTGSSAKNVPAIITLGSSESFRLCFGQAADDSDHSGDYNAQYWIKWIDTIELY